MIARTNLSHPIPVLLDCDTGIDDALALIYMASLHRRGVIELKLVSTTAGNVDARQTAINTKYVLELCGVKDVPVVMGEESPLQVPLTTTPETHGPKGLGYVTPPEEMAKKLDTRPWVELWEEVLESAPETHVIVTGPATNLARYIRGHKSPKKVTLMGGAYLYPGNTTPTAEWNSWVDPHAAKEVFLAELDMTVCSLGVTEQFTIDPAELEELQEIVHDAPIGQILEPALRFYFEFHQAQGEGYLAQIHDLLTCMIAVDRVPTKHVMTCVDVEAESELLRGTTVADVKGHWDRKNTVRLITDADIEQAHSELAREWAHLNQQAH